MKYKLNASTLSAVKADAVVVIVFQGEAIGPVLASLDKGKSSNNGFFQQIVEAAREDKFTGKPGEIAYYPTYGQIAAKRIVLAGFHRRASSSQLIHESWQRT